MELIKPDNSEYRRYEELLLKRDELLKEAAVMQIRYIQEFGELMVRSFRIKNECLKLKKKLAFSQMMINHDKVIDPHHMQHYVDKETAGYDRQLKVMVHDFRRAMKTELPTEAVALEVIRLYRKVAVKIHPEINSKTGITPQLADMWNEVLIAFHENDISALERLDAMIDSELDKLGEYLEIYIPEMKEKIILLEEETDTIISSDPYRYKDILNNAELVEEKRTLLRREIHDYMEYEDEMEHKFEAIFLHKKIRFTWQGKESL